jgi:hypothetical protein
MLRRPLILLSLFLSFCFSWPAQALVAAPADCKADVDLTADGGLKVAVHYRCRSNSAVVFRAAGEAAAAHMMQVTDGAGRSLRRGAGAWPIEPVKVPPSFATAST